MERVDDRMGSADDRKRIELVSPSEAPPTNDVLMKPGQTEPRSSTRQIGLLLWKNFKLRRKSKTSTCCEFFCAIGVFVFCGVLRLLPGMNLENEIAAESGTFYPSLFSRMPENYAYQEINPCSAITSEYVCDNVEEWSACNWNYISSTCEYDEYGYIYYGRFNHGLNMDSAMRAFICQKKPWFDNYELAAGYFGISPMPDSTASSETVAYKMESVIQRLRYKYWKETLGGWSTDENAEWNTGCPFRGTFEAGDLSDSDSPFQDVSVSACSGKCMYETLDWVDGELVKYFSDNDELNQYISTDQYAYDPWTANCSDCPSRPVAMALVFNSISDDYADVDYLLRFNATDLPTTSVNLESWERDYTLLIEQGYDKYLDSGAFALQYYIDKTLAELNMEARSDEDPEIKAMYIFEIEVTDANFNITNTVLYDNLPTTLFSGIEISANGASLQLTEQGNKADIFWKFDDSYDINPRPCLRLFIKFTDDASTLTSFYSDLTDGLTNYMTGFNDQISADYYGYTISLVDVISTYAAGSVSTSFEVGVFNFPVTGYLKDDYHTYFGTTLPTLFFAAFVYSFSQTVAKIVNEKASKITEGMKMMGASGFNLWASHYIYALMFSLWVSVWAAIILKGMLVYRYMDGFILFLWVFLFSFSSCCLAIMISTLFDNKKTASQMSAVLFYLLFFLGGFNMAEELSMWLSLFAPVALTVSNKSISALERIAVGVTFDNWTVAMQTSEQQGISVQAGVTMMFIDTILYIFLTWYFDNTFPSKYGVKKPFYFCCTKTYWLKTPENDYEPEEALMKNDNMIQDSNRNDAPSIDLRGLTKTFGAFTAVNSLDLQIYEGEIFCLLGHNGAGKTTTISMLTGLLPISRGSASVNGKDVSTAIEDVRHSMGLCPQHNVLWDELTVTDHLKFFAALKGVPKGMVEKEVEALIDKVGLRDQANTQSGNLSGGQQRKLSLVIALCGGSKIVFLDEVTSGMDPHSRRDTWNLIREVQKNRTIVLTTHFMDEADYLADRIGIMTHGQIACLGTSLFLKERYGVGYSFVISLEQEVSAQVMRETYDEIINKWIDNAENLSMAASELSYRLPFESSEAIPNLLRDLDAQKAKIHMLEYGISVTTLEEVFMKVGEQDLANEGVSLKKQLSKRSSVYGEKKTNEPVERQNTAALLDKRREERSQVQLFGYHLYAMLYKKFWWTSRDKRAFCCSFLVPSIILVLGLALMKLPIATSFPERTLQDMALEYGDVNPIPFNEFNANETTVRYYSQSFANLMALDSLQHNWTFSAYVVEEEKTIEFVVDTVLSRSPDAFGIAFQVSEDDDTDYDIISTTTRSFTEEDLPTSNDDEEEDGSVIRTTDFRADLSGIDCSGVTTSWQEVDLDPKGYTTATSTNSLYYDAGPYSFDYRYNDGSEEIRTKFHKDETTFMVKRPFVTSIDPNDNFQITADMDSITIKLLSICAGGASSSDPCRGIPQDEWDASSYDNDVYVRCREVEISLDMTMNVAASAIQTEMSSTSESEYGQLTAYGGILQQYRNWQDNEFLAGYKTEIYEEGLSKNVDEYAYLGIYVQPVIDSDESQIKFGLGANISGYHGLPISENLAINLFKSVYGSGAITASMSPFKSTASEEQLYDQINSFLQGTFISLAFCIIPAGIIYNVVWEKVSHVKHQQYVSGTGPLAFWLGEFLFDWLIFIPACAVATVLLLAFDIEGLGGAAGGVIFLVSAMYGFAVTPFTFLIGRLFNDPMKAQMTVVMGYMVSCLVLILVDWFIDLIADEDSSTWQVNRDLRFIYRLFPPYLLGNTILQLSTRDVFFFHPEGLSMWDWEVSGRNLLYMAWEGLFYFVINLLLEYVAHSPALRNFLRINVNQPKDQEELDGDVLEERARIEKLIEGGVDETLGVKYPIIINRLRRVFKTGSKKCRRLPNKVAVRDLSYAIPRGEVFGFLGVNGAGKTTTLRLLTGIFPPSEGTAYLNGFPITDQMNVRRSIGYCPQFDALFDLLTARETIKVYGLIKGLSGEDLESQSQTMIDKLLLTDYQDKCAGTYSGGNKRKLSVSIALIGEPPIVFLDEPSTGIDPVARRFMWNFISETMNGRSVILTTHSMEECEALCHRIGILVNGQLTCIGTSQHLKSRFGNAFEVTITMSKQGDEDRLLERFRGEFNTVTKQECHNVTLKVKIDKGSYELPEIFERLSNAKERMGFESFAVQQTSLEQVFIQMAGEQEDYEADAVTIGILEDDATTDAKPGSNHVVAF